MSANVFSRSLCVRWRVFPVDTCLSLCVCVCFLLFFFQTERCQAHPVWRLWWTFGVGHCVLNVQWLLSGLQRGPPLTIIFKQLQYVKQSCFRSVRMLKHYVLNAQMHIKRRGRIVWELLFFYFLQSHKFAYTFLVLRSKAFKLYDLNATFYVSFHNSPGCFSQQFAVI